MFAFVVKFYRLSLDNFYIAIALDFVSLVMRGVCSSFMEDTVQSGTGSKIRFGNDG